MRKLDLGYPRFLSIMNDTDKYHLSPQPEDSSRATAAWLNFWFDPLKETVHLRKICIFLISFK